MNRKEFEAWIDSRLDSFANVLSDKRKPWVRMDIRFGLRNEPEPVTESVDNFYISCNPLTRETVIFNIATKHCAVARCHIDDEFNVRKGVAIAWAKYNHEPVPNWENSIPREELVNGDKFISSVNQHHTITFIGWLPNMKNGLVGKWAIAVDDYYKPVKTQIAEEVVKVD